MAEKEKYGIDGAVEINGTTIAYISEFSLDMSREIKEASFFRGKGKEKTAGIFDWSASCNGRAEFTDESGQKKLYEAFKNGDEVTLKLFMGKKTYFSGKALIESLKVDNSAEGEYNIESSFAGTGELTENILTANLG